MPAGFWGETKWNEVFKKICLAWGSQADIVLLGERSTSVLPLDQFKWMDLRT
jgi:hypothetical protein